MTRLFDLAAPFYGRLTANRLWRESVHEMARHFPPSGATLRLLDIGCGPANSALELLRLRPDVCIIGLDRSRGMLRQAQQVVRIASEGGRVQLAEADACQLPLPANSLDAITAHSVYYLLSPEAKPAFLTEALRVLRPGGRLIMLDPAAIPYPLSVIHRAPRAALSVLAWHAVSRTHERLTPQSIARTLGTAGFARVLGERAVEGCGVLSRGEKPFINQTPVERTADVAALDEDSATTNLQIIHPVTGFDQVRGRNLFLLIQQTPNKPVWTLKPGELITWGVATASDNGVPVALAFTSLPKAVAFMQPAVIAGVLIGINKVAKFDRSVAARWDFPIVLNPTLDALRESSRYKLPGALIGIDPQTAVTGEE